MNKTFCIALAGNPNCGKSTIFNALTGSHQHVGNWPGKTVEKKEGFFKQNNSQIMAVDLPGTYSLTAYSLEEVITRDYILNEKPDAVISVLDSANLERNLYLTVQILELGAPIIIDLNMSDITESRGFKIDVEKLSDAFGAKVVKTIGNQGKGIDKLKQVILEMVASNESEEK